MHPVRERSDGRIIGVPTSKNEGHEKYTKKQKAVLEKAAQFARENADVIRDAIGRRFEDNEYLKMTKGIEDVASALHSSRIGRKRFKAHIEKVYEASPGQGAPKMPGLMAHTVTEILWSEAFRIKPLQTTIEEKPL